MLDRQLRPRVIDDIGEWPFFPRKGGNGAIYIVGALGVDRYVTVPEHAIESIRKVIRLFDGRNSIEAIERQFSQEERKSVDVGAIYTRLSQAGLIASPSADVDRRSDIDALLIGVTDIRIGRVPTAVRAAIRTLTPVLATTAGVVICCGSLIYLSDRMYLAGATPSMLVLPLMWLSCALHECAHGIAAIYFGLSPRRLRAAFFLGLVPFIYLRLGGLYTLTPAQRVVVWMAGIFANLALASSLVLALRYGLVPPGFEGVGRTVAGGNYVLALMNLFPFMPTDGYFVAMTLCRAHNLRGRALGTLSELLRGRWNGESPYVAFYLAGGLITIVAIVGQSVFKTGANQRGGMHLALGSLLLVVVALWTAASARQHHSAWRSRLTRVVRWAAVAAGFYLSGMLANVVGFAASVFSIDAINLFARQHYIALTLSICGAFAAMLAATRPSGSGERPIPVSPAIPRLLAVAATVASCALLVAVRDAGMPLRALWVAVILLCVMTSGRRRVSPREAM